MNDSQLYEVFAQEEGVKSGKICKSLYTKYIRKGPGFGSFRKNLTKKGLLHKIMYNIDRASLHNIIGPALLR